jgi:predicted DNA binding CopG/RHH family protein
MLRISMLNKMETNLTNEENDIIEYLESGKAQSVENLQDEISRYTTMAKQYSNKKKAISIRLPESDIYLLKQKALQTGLSYQNIIQSLVHQYTHNKIKPTL